MQTLGKKLAFAFFKKTIQHFAIFPKLIREMSLFWNSIFFKIELSPIVVFLRSL